MRVSVFAHTATKFILIGAAIVTSVHNADAWAQNRVLDERVPAAILEAWKNAPELVGSPSLAWTDRDTVTVAFNRGDDQVRRLIEKTAQEWLDPSIPLRFSFRAEDGKWRTWSRNDRFAGAAVRIDFSLAEEDGGYWSAIGRMATVVSAKEQTMNLGDLIDELPQYGDGTSREWAESYARHTILHEFGHALGLAHEHFHPDCQADLKIAEAVDYLQGPPNNWKKPNALFNIDANYYFKASKMRADAAFPRQDNNAITSAQIDRASVMMYSLEDKYFKNTNNSPCRSSSPIGYAIMLSNGDKAAVKRFYPKQH